MSKARPPTHVAILAFPEVTPSTVYGMYDLFLSAGRDWGLVVDGKPGTSLIRPRVVSRLDKPFVSASGVRITPEAGLEDGPAPDIVCVPEVAVPPGEPIEGRFDVEIDCLKRRFAGGSVLATACSGAILLAEAGLLDGEEATTHWAYCDVVAKRYPKVTMRPKRALVVTGDGGRLVMAGGGTSWLDLALYLIARCTDVETAMQCARINLIDWHDIGQQPFARLARTRQVDDAIVARCQTRIASIGWSVDEALTFVLSGGTTAPERIRLNRREGRSPDPRSTPPAASGGQVPAEAGPLAAGPRETRQG